jgi:carotenoid cleavage dioxygenase-like enzyme
MGAPVPNDVRLKGPFQPMRFEATVEDCIVTEGEIPKDITGGFYRVGPTWKRPTLQGTNGLLSMDGMVQSLVFENGRADYRNRWVRTPKYLLEDKLGRGAFEWSDGEWGDYRTWGYGEVKQTAENKGVAQGTNNINVFPFAGEVLASGEQGGPPVALDPITLETKGVVRWSDELSDGMIGGKTFTAHPKWDNETGELYGWAYKDTPPYVTIHLVTPDGTVRSRVLEDAPYNANAHDIWLTEDYMVMPFQPFLNSQERVRAGKSIWEWDPEKPITLALIPRSLEGEVRWIETDLEPQYIMHTMAANTRDNKLELDGPIFDRPPFPFEFDVKEGEAVPLFFSIAKSSLGRWTIDLETGKAKSEQLSDRPAELPKIDERYFGKNYEWGYMVGGDAKKAGMSMKSLVAHNMRTGREDEFRIRHDNPVAVLETAFVPRKSDADEGDGWIIVPVSRWRERVGEFLIFDTYDISDGPVCRIEIPFLMGWTPHGHWMDFR